MLYTDRLCFKMSKAKWLKPCKIFVKKLETRKNSLFWFCLYVVSLNIPLPFLVRRDEGFFVIIIGKYTASRSQKYYFVQVTSVD